MADHEKAAKHFGLAQKAAKTGDGKLAAHHAGHGLSALRENVTSLSGFAGAPRRRPPAIAPVQEGGESDMADVPVQTGSGLMARLRSFGKSGPK